MSSSTFSLSALYVEIFGTPTFQVEEKKFIGGGLKGKLKVVEATEGIDPEFRQLVLAQSSNCNLLHTENLEASLICAAQETNRSAKLLQIQNTAAETMHLVIAKYLSCESSNTDNRRPLFQLLDLCALSIISFAKNLQLFDYYFQLRFYILEDEESTPNLNYPLRLLLTNTIYN